jgi:hypothetical protein
MQHGGFNEKHSKPNPALDGDKKSPKPEVETQDADESQEKRQDKGKKSDT